MGDPNFGIVIRKVDREPRPVYGADLSTIGLIGPAPAADASVFPLDTPVLIYSNDNDKLAKLGDQGYMRDAIQGINDQLGEGQFAARVDDGGLQRLAAPDDGAVLLEGGDGQGLVAQGPGTRELRTRCQCIESRAPSIDSGESKVEVFGRARARHGCDRWGSPPPPSP